MSPPFVVYNSIESSILIMSWNRFVMCLGGLLDTHEFPFPSVNWSLSRDYVDFYLGENRKMPEGIMFNGSVPNSIDRSCSRKCFDSEFRDNDVMTELYNSAVEKLSLVLDGDDIELVSTDDMELWDNTRRISKAWNHAPNLFRNLNELADGVACVYSYISNNGSRSIRCCSISISLQRMRMSVVQDIYVGVSATINRLEGRINMMTELGLVKDILQIPFITSRCLPSDVKFVMKKMIGKCLPSWFSDVFTWSMTWRSSLYYPNTGMYPMAYGIELTYIGEN